MRIGIILILICLFSGIAANAQQSPTQDEVRKLNIEVVRLFNEKKYDAALPKAESSLKLCEQSFGKDSPKTIDSLKNLAAVYTALDQYEKSANTYKRVVNLVEAQAGDNNKALISFLLLMGNQYSRAKKDGPGLSVYDRSLKIAEKIYEVDSKEFIPIYKGTSIFNARVGNHYKAITHYERLIALQEKHIGSEHPDTAESLALYSVVLRIAGKKKEADVYDEKVRRVYQLMYLPDKTEKVEGGVLQGSAIYKVAPRYPSTAKSNRVQGTVEIQVTIDEAGFVINAIAISGPDDLRDTSKDAAMQWRFRPTMLEGQPVKVQGILTFHFTLN